MSGKNRLPKTEKTKDKKEADQPEPPSTKEIAAAVVDDAIEKKQERVAEFREKLEAKKAAEKNGAGKPPAEKPAAGEGGEPQKIPMFYLRPDQHSQLREFVRNLAVERWKTDPIQQMLDTLPSGVVEIHPQHQG